MVPSTADLANQAARDGDLCLLKLEGFKGRSLLHFAAGGGHLEVCKFLVEDSGFHVNSASAEGETAILLALEATEGNGNLPVLMYLLDRGGDPAMPDARRFTPLHNAAENGHYEAVRLLLSKDVPVDPLNHRGTPLIVAAAMGQDQVVKILLDHGADPNKLVHYDYSPLTMACCARSLKRVKLLTQAGADVNSKSPHELPVLMIAAILKDLLDATLFSNKSLCWLRLGDGELALLDAQQCKTLRPRWSKAWYREGAALSLLKDYEGAINAFMEALKLGPANYEIKKALREATDSLTNAGHSGEQNP